MLLLSALRARALELDCCAGVEAEDWTTGACAAPVLKLKEVACSGAARMGRCLCAVPTTDYRVTVTEVLCCCGFWLALAAWLCVFAVWQIGITEAAERQRALPPTPRMSVFTVWNG